MPEGADFHFLKVIQKVTGKHFLTTKIERIQIEQEKA